MPKAQAVTLATAYLDAKNPSGALRVISPLLASAPDDVSALTVASRAFLAVGDSDEALKLAQRACALEPDNDQVWRISAMILTKMKRFAEARTSAETAQAIAPSLWLSHLVLAEVDHAQGVITEAGWRAAKEAVRLAPNEPEAYVVVGNLARVSRDLPAAAAAYQSALRLQPENVNARNNLAVIALQRGNSGSAARDFLSLLSIDPTSAVGNFNVRVAMRSAVTRTMGLVALVVLLEIYALGPWGLLPDTFISSADSTRIAIAAFALASAVVVWRAFWLRRTSGDRFTQIIQTMRASDKRSIVYTAILVGVLAVMLAACFTSPVAAALMCIACLVTIVVVTIDSRVDLERQRQRHLRSR